MEAHAAALLERAPMDDRWRDLGQMMLPYALRFLDDQPNDGRRKDGRIINNVAGLSVRSLASGLMAWLSSPARPWFRVGLQDKDLMRDGGVARWLYTVDQTLRDIYDRSNFYKALFGLYRNEAVFGPAVTVLDSDIRNVIHAFDVPIGSFCLSTGPDRRVDTLYRSYQATVIQLARRFGIEALSKDTRAKYDASTYGDWVEVLHVIEPNDEHVPNALGALGKPFRAVYIEAEAGASEPPLEISGYDEWPVLSPRWDVEGEDFYGISPGLMALGDTRQLQSTEKKIGKAEAKLLDPPMKGPAALKRRRASLVPGDITYIPRDGAGVEFGPAHDYDARGLEYMRMEAGRLENRISRAFYAEVLQMLAATDRRQMTAREISERHEEKVTEFGPVVEQQQTEVHIPAIDRTFGIALRMGLIPRPPPELSGQRLNVEFISTMAQAQKLLGTASTERFLGLVGNVSGAVPDILDNVDFDEAIRDYAEKLNVNPNVIVPEDQVQAIRARREEQRAAAMQQQQFQSAAQGAKILSETDTSRDSALSRVAGLLGGGQAGGAA